MKSCSNYLNDNRARVLMTLGVLLAIAFSMAFPDLLNPGDTMIAGVLLETAELSPEFKKALEDLGNNFRFSVDKVKELSVRLLAIEQSRAHKHGGSGLGDGAGGASDIAQAVINDAGMAQFKNGNLPAVQIKIPSAAFKAAIVNATGTGQPLVVGDRQREIVAPPQRRFTIRDLFASIPTGSNTVEFTQETSFTNNADVQFSSPNDRENVIKAESTMAFALLTAQVVTIAHWLAASRQVLSDAPLLERYISTRLMYGLKLKEEAQFLIGDGTGGNMNGINTQASAYTQGASNDTKLDAIAKAIVQLILLEFNPTGVILNPSDWLGIRLLKDTTGRYLFGDPQAQTEPRLWGLPVVATNSQTAGQFTVLDAAQAGFIADREDALIRISENVNDDFIRNMVRILCEERAVIVIERPTAIVKGTLPAIGT